MGITIKKGISMKKFLAFLGVGSAGSLMAQQATAPIDTISASLATEMGNWSTSITSFFTTNIGVIMGIIGVGLAVGLIWVAYRLFRKATGKAS